MASSMLAPAASPVCPVCHSTTTRPSRRRHVQDWTHLLDGVSAWRCQCCRERFYLQSDGTVTVPPAAPVPRRPFLHRLRWVRRLRRWWHNSYRWRLQHGRRLRRRTVMALSLALLVGFFLFVLAHYAGRAG